MKKIFETFKKWLGGLFKDESGTPSSKRFVGIMCGLTLCICLYHNSFTTEDVAPPQYLVDAVSLLAFGCLGLASLDKFTAIRKEVKDATSQDPKEIPCKTCGNQPCTCPPTN